MDKFAPAWCNQTNFGVVKAAPKETRKIRQMQADRQAEQRHRVNYTLRAALLKAGVRA